MENNDPFNLLKTYEQQSFDHGINLPENELTLDIWSGIGFRVGNYFLASDFSDITEIITVPPITKIPTSQNWLLGIANIRGNLMAISDLSGFLLDEKTTITKQSRILCINHENDLYGLLIDEILGLRHFEKSHEQSNTTFNEKKLKKFVDNEFQMDQCWGVLNLHTLMADHKFMQVSV